MAIEIAIETPLQDDVRALVAELNATLLELTPPRVPVPADGRADGGADTDRLHRARRSGLAIGMRRAEAP